MEEHLSALRKELGMPPISRRQAVSLALALGGGCLLPGRSTVAAKQESKWEAGLKRGLDWVARTQSSLGHWTADAKNEAAAYPTAMTALAGLALICSGSTTTQGPYAKHVGKAVDYLLDKLRSSGLIGDPDTDNRYTYGHGFSMLFLSQVLGEEEDEDRRDELVEALTKAVQFSGKAQTSAGGWGYVSARAMNDFDEGSTTITQVQGLRSCRNAGIVVPGEIIEKAKQYIYICKNDDGGISYSSRNKGTSRPAITAAALAALYNAGDYDSEHVPSMLEYAKKQLHTLDEGGSSFGHWHYTYLYYSQVMYRQGEKEWGPYRDRLYDRIIADQHRDGYWVGSGAVGPIYATACNLVMLQLDKSYLPIFQR
jgi:hypothetical protein